MHINTSVDTKKILGLGQKFCIQPRRVKIRSTIRIIDEFKRDVRLQDYFKSNSFDEDDKVPRPCRSNEKWKLSKATGSIEYFLKKFETSAYLETNIRTHLKSSNLKKLQHNGLSFLRNNKQHVVLVVDENTGLCAANRNECTASMINQHFGN